MKEEIKKEEVKEKKVEEVKKEEPVELEEKTKSTELIEKANLAALRQEEANKIHKELLDREEALKVEETLGGNAEAGTAEKTQEEKGIESAKKLLEGTGLETHAFPEEKKE